MGLFSVGTSGTQDGENLSNFSTLVVCKYGNVGIHIRRGRWGEGTVYVLKGLGLIS